MRFPLRALAAAAVLAVAAPAFAQTDQAQPDQPAAQADQGRRMSPEAREAMQSMRQACEADIKSLCADAQASGDRRAVGRCLRQNADKASPDCKSALEKLRSLRQQSQQPQ